jgi:hypothetical protein
VTSLQEKEQRKRWSAVSDRSFLVLAVVTFVGIVLVAVGWILQGQSYVPGLLQQLGSSLMLLVPLALLGFMLEGRLRRTEEQLRATTAQLHTLTAATREGLAESRQRQDQVFDQARRAPSRGAIHELLSDALRIEAIDPAGIRVRVPATTLRLRFRSSDTDILVLVEEAYGAELGKADWNSSESAEAFAQELAGVLRKLDRYPGDASYDPAMIFRQLLEILQLGIQARTGEYGHDLERLIEKPNEYWAICAGGLYSLQRHYHIPAARITSGHMDWARHMRSLGWVDEAAFDEAYSLARRLLAPPGADRA